MYPDQPAEPADLLEEVSRPFRKKPTYNSQVKHVKEPSKCIIS